MGRKRIDGPRQPCVLCRTTGGATNGARGGIARRSVAAFAMEGKACLRCYNRLAQSDYRGRQKDKKCAVSNATVSGGDA